MGETCYQTLLKNVNRNGVIVYYGHKIPVARFLRDVERLCGGFVRIGLQKGDVVTLYLPTCPQSLAAFYACSKLGLVANFVHPLVPLKLLAENLQKTCSKALLFYDALVKDERKLAKLNQKLVRCSIADYVTWRKLPFAAYSVATCGRRKGVVSYRSLLKAEQPTEICGNGEDVVCYMHSGGTSGAPKIVKLTNDAVNGTAAGIQKMYHPAVDESCFNLATLPVFHAYGLCAGIHAPLIIGYSLVIVPKFKPRRVVQALHRYKVTCWSVVPSMIKKLMKCNRFDDKRALQNLDVIWCGGDVLDEKLVAETDEILKKHCPRAQLMRGYGLTETCGVCVVNNFDAYKTGSCGKPMHGCVVQAVDENFHVLPRGAVGELAICADGNMQGYLDGENPFVQLDEKQFVLTGDVGTVDEDGFVFVLGRKKRSIKIAAVNVFPAQVESCVQKLDFVDEACAVGVTVNEKPFVKVFVTLNTPTDAETVQKSVTEICQNNLMPYAVPHFVEVLDQMPRTAMGKVDYVKLEKFNKQ